MSFVSVLALAVAALVVAPYVAHRLRRRRADERLFAPAELVPPAPPRARRRSRIEDKTLFGIRSLAIVALAVLGASPLVRCSSLSLHREGGASVALAIVIDDSMSMRAPAASGASGTGTRFERARRGANQLLESAREGDAVAIVLAGTPPRVSLAATTDLAAARTALDNVTQSDRATDLDGAIAMARALVAQLPQVDKRVVVLSDLADGQPEGPAVGSSGAIPVWVPLPELRADAVDCGILSAERSSEHVRVSIACGHGSTTAGREITLRTRGGDDVVGRGPSPPGAGGDVSVSLPKSAPEELVARLEGSDAIAADNVATVLPEASAPAIAVIAESADETTVTGGAPVVEQALTALRLDVTVRPVPALPDRAVDLTGFVGVIIDDPPGFTPEQRGALLSFLEQGGQALVALGPRASEAPLGASLEPVLAHASAWVGTTSKGAASAHASPLLLDAARSLGALGAASRASLSPEDTKAFEPLLAWDDGAPLVARRAVGRGAAWIVTLPFSVSVSELTLRPGFLALLDAWTDEARARAVPLRTDVGRAWTFTEHDVTVVGPAGPLPIVREASLVRAVPPLVGAYLVTAGGKTQTRAAAPLAVEMDLRPRAAAETTKGGSLGEAHASVDISWAVALFLLALLAVELGFRVQRARRPEAVA